MPPYGRNHARRNQVGQRALYGSLFLVFWILLGEPLREDQKTPRIKANIAFRCREVKINLALRELNPAPDAVQVILYTIGKRTRLCNQPLGSCLHQITATELALEQYEALFNRSHVVFDKTLYIHRLYFPGGVNLFGPTV